MVAYIVLVAASFAIASILLGSISFAQTNTPQEPTSSSVTIANSLPSLAMPEPGSCRIIVQERGLP